MNQYYNYENILLNELNLALGCTEPIAIALASSTASSFFDSSLVKTVDVFCSASILKNAHSVTVPNSNGSKGVKAAIALGIYGGNSKHRLEVLKDVNNEDIEKAKKLEKSGKIKTHLKENVDNIYIKVEINYEDNNKVCAIVSHAHNHVSYISVNEKILVNEPLDKEKEEQDYSTLTLKNIFDFINKINLKDYPEIVDRINESIKINSNIAYEGLTNNWGIEVGKTIKKLKSIDDVYAQATAFTCAGSDARMSGCSLPVMINSGSGNQGMTVSLPIIYYVKENNIELEKLQKALIFSNLVSIHQKHHIGKLSAFCGVVCSAAAAVSGIAYLKGMNLEQIEIIITNTLATSGGLFCDGATPSCALKIAVALNNAFLSLELAKNYLRLKNKEGIVGNNIEKTIDNIGLLASEKMKLVDKTILNMIADSK